MLDLCLLNMKFTGSASVTLGQLQLLTLEGILVIGTTVPYTTVQYLNYEGIIAANIFIFM